MRTIITAALVSTIALAAPAMAQERAPFTGPRAEAVVGWDRVQAGGGHEDGVTYGGQIGYDFQVGGLVAGIEGEVSGSSTDACDGPGSAATPNLCLKAGRDLYAGGRVGGVVGGNTLLYAKAGYDNARIRVTSNNGTTTTTLGGRNLDGVRVGAGLEHQFGRNFYGKAEYQYTNYEQGLSRHGVLAGVGVRF